MLVKKKIIGLTGSSGVLGKRFIKNYKKKYKFVKYPYRLENTKKINYWTKKNSKIDKFIHFAAISNKSIIKKNPKKALEVNYKSTINLINLLNKNTNLKYFNFISTSNVYKSSLRSLKENSVCQPNNYYGHTKLKTENYIQKNSKEFNFKIGVSRVFNYTSPDQSEGYFIPDVIRKLKKRKKEKRIFFSNLNQRRNFSHIDDICLAINHMLEKNSKGFFNISSGNTIILKDLVKIIIKKMNLKIKLQTDKKKNNLVPNINKLKRLGYKPKKKLKDILYEFEKKGRFKI